MHIWFEYDKDLYNIKLESNVFKHNSSHTNRSIIEIVNDVGQFDEKHLDGEEKRSVTLHHNTLEENGSHGNGVLYIATMPNVDISDNNVISSNTDEVDLNTKVIF